jgi:NAD(P)-dependent dehydrogenase (short-subunit alcohol dehydrogenase family)
MSESATDRSKQRCAVVAGGTRGIGAAVAQALARDGWRVVAGGIETDGSTELAPHPLIQQAHLDVTDDASVAALIDGCARIDALVNCAGILVRRHGEFEIAGFARVLDVNLTGTMRMCLAAKDKLAAAGGAIVNTASMYAFFGAAHAPAYAASKGGVAQLSKSLAIAWAEDGIRVNAIAPGWIVTDLTRPARDNPERSRAILERTPMARWGEPQDVAGAVLYLLSDAARFVTGTVLPIDGGYASM